MRAGAIDRDLGPRNTGLLLGAMLAPVALGISTTAIALPAVSADLGLSGPQAAWILGGYALTQAMFIPLFGRILDRRGLRIVLAGAGAMMAVGALGAAASQSFAALLASRLLQGSAAGAIMVSALGIVASRFEPMTRPRVLGIMTGVLGIISGAGTLIGGVLTDASSWRVVVALPALSVPFLLGCLLIAPAMERRRGRADPLGALLTAAAAAVVFMLLEAPSTKPTDTVLVLLAAIGIVVILVLVRHVQTNPDGFLPLNLVRNPGFVLAAVSAMSIFAAYASLLFAVPILLFASHDWTATDIGLALLPAAGTGIVSANLVGRLLARRDPYRITAALAGGSALGVVACGAGGGAWLTSVVGLGLVLGAQTGCNVALMSRVPLMVDPGDRNLATGAFSLIFQLGGALGTAVVAGLAAPLGIGGALAAIGLLPAVGVGLALRSGQLIGRPDLLPVVAPAR